MTLGRKHVEAARFESLLSLRFNIRFDGLLERLHFGIVQLAAEGFRLRRRFIGQTHLDVAAQLNIGASSSHVGGDGHRARHARLRDDRGLLLVMACVEDLVRNFLGGQE